MSPPGTASRRTAISSAVTRHWSWSADVAGSPRSVRMRRQSSAVGTSSMTTAASRPSGRAAAIARTAAVSWCASGRSAAAAAGSRPGMWRAWLRE
ncbi:hypothetical protein [Streptomyces sp. NPDC090445]|uniref:hypothetical protein n=1 Tax=Streptomyces sp. NPDC090445 TaxID=3365963 RepID=UPI00381AF83B